jgi:hypothetical protein
MQRFLPVFLSVAVILGLFPAVRPAWSQYPDPSSRPVDLDIRIGYNGYYHTGRWVPVIVTAVTADRPFRDTLVLKVETSHGRWDIYELPLDLSPSTTKRYRFLAYLADRQPEYTFRLERAQRQIPVTVTSILENEDLVLVLGKDRDRELLPPTLLSSQMEIEDESVTVTGEDGTEFQLPSPLLSSQREHGGADLARVAPDFFPDARLGLEGVDLLVVRASLLPTLEEDQVQAIIEYVLSGGTLFFHPEGYQDTSGALDPILPAAVEGLEVIPFTDPFGGKFGEGPPAGGEISRPKLSLRPGAEVLLGTEEDPILVLGKAGFGRVLVYTFDPGAEWVSGHPGSERFWKTVLGTAGDRGPRMWGMEWDEDSPMSYLPYGYNRDPGVAINTFLVRGRGTGNASILFIVVFLIVYVLAIGSTLVLFFAAGKNRRRAVAVIPLLSVLFAGAALGSGYVMSARGFRSRQLEVVHKISGASVGLARTAFSVAAPSSGRLTIVSGEIPEHFLSLPIHKQWESPTGGEFQRDVLLRPPEVSFHMHAMTVKSFTGEGLVPLEGEISADLQLRLVSLSGTITNSLPFDLESCLVVHGDEVIPIGDLPAGESVILSASDVPKVSPGPTPTPGSAWFGMIPYFGGLGDGRSDTHLLELSDLWSRRPVSPAYAPPEAAEAYTAFLQADRNTMYSWRPVTFLLGTADRSFLEPRLAGRSMRRKSTTVVFHPLDRIDADHITLGFTSFSLDRRMDEDAEPWMMQTAGGRVSIPIPEAERTTRIEITTRMGYARAQLSVLKPESGTWETLPEPEDGNETWVLSPAEEYIDPTGGDVRFKLDENLQEVMQTIKVRIDYDQD